MNTPRLPDRRAFLKSGLVSIIAAAVVPQIVPARLFGARAPSNRVTLGFVGVGLQGHDVNLKSFLHEEDCVARVVCDVFKSRATRAKETVDTHYGNRDCLTSYDFREVLARPDLDAIVISTPDHWHVPMSILALEAGKHVLCEKPTLTIEEGRRLVEATKRSGRVFATALEDRAVIQYHMLAEAVRNGAIGELRHMEVGLRTKPIYPREDPAPVPPDLDWDLWLGPAPFRPYSPSITQEQVWRQIRDFSGGTLTDWGAHLVDTAQVANFAEHSSPVWVEGRGEFPPDSLNTVAHRYELNYRYANGVTMRVTSEGTSLRFEGTAGWVGNRGWLGRLEGSDIEVFRRKYDPATNRIWSRPPREQRNFLDCLKNGQPPMYTAEALHRLSTTLHLGSVAMELGRPVRWDPEAEVFLDDPEANALRARPARRDWDKA